MLMGGVAVAAIVIAIVVAVKTFSEPSINPVKLSSQPITGSWMRKDGFQFPESLQGPEAEYMIVKDIVAFDVSAGDSGSVTLSTVDGSLEGKVVNSQPGIMLLQVKTKGGKTAQLKIAQMGDGGPVVVTDSFLFVQFERKPK